MERLLRVGKDSPSPLPVPGAISLPSFRAYCADHSVSPGDIGTSPSLRVMLPPRLALPRGPVHSCKWAGLIRGTGIEIVLNVHKQLLTLKAQLNAHILD